MRDDLCGKRQCQEDETWSGSEPTCQGITMQSRSSYHPILRPCKFAEQHVR